MLKSFFSRSNPVSIQSFLNAIYHNGGGDLYKALKINSSKIQRSTFEEILSNEGDIADGVTAVEKDFSTRYFDLFDGLVIKHYDNGVIKWMFFVELKDATKVFNFYRAIVDTIGHGLVHDHKFATFNQQDKILSLSQGNFEQESDELVNSWYSERSTFILNYRIKPLRQFIFSVHVHPKKQNDPVPRTKGTLLRLLHHDLSQILLESELKKEIVIENQVVKFIDYTFELNPPELSIFNQVEIRIFGNEKLMIEDTHTNVNYFSTDPIDVTQTILLVDKLCKLYGTDNHGDMELRPHEIDMLENNEFWTGRSWDFNTEHAIIDYNDDMQRHSYNISLSFDPESKGLSLFVLAFNTIEIFS